MPPDFCSPNRSATRHQHDARTPCHAGADLPVTWVYIAARNVRGPAGARANADHLPIVVAGVCLSSEIVLPWRSALLESLPPCAPHDAAQIRATSCYLYRVQLVFRRVHMLGVGWSLSLVLQLLSCFTWRDDFGRTCSRDRKRDNGTEQLQSLRAPRERNGTVPGPRLVLALTPGKASELAARFERVRNVLGRQKKRATTRCCITSNRTARRRYRQKVLDEIEALEAARSSGTKQARRDHTT